MPANHDPTVAGWCRKPVFGRPIRRRASLGRDARDISSCQWRTVADTVGVRPFQFLVGVRGEVDRQTLIEGVRAAESAGYSGLTIHDHLTRQLAPIPVLTAVAMATERLRLYPFVFNNDLRHPAVLAQELATLDVLSGGRVVVGIGAGWNEPEYRATGIAFDPAGRRIDRMEEAIAILRGLFGQGPFSFHGRSYDIEAMDGHPKPVQQPIRRS